MALYSQFVPQEGAAVFLIGEQSTVVAQTVSDNYGRYVFPNVPPLPDGETYTIVACLDFDEESAYTGSFPSVVPDQAAITTVDIYMALGPTSCEA